MNISKIVRSAKCGVLGALVAVGMTALAEPTVTVGEVTTGDPWSTITVNYTLGGTDVATDYKVAFDVTAGGVTKGVTNAAAKVENKGYSQEIDTAALFGAATPDTKAKVKVSLIALKPEAGVQLWEDGPYWAESNLGTSEVQGHPEYGALYNFADAAKVKLGGDWRLPTKGELEKLASASYCTNEWDSVNMGYTFTGATVGYKDKSIFLPAAGYFSGFFRESAGVQGYYWSSEKLFGSNFACYLVFSEGDAGVNYRNGDAGLSVRAVRDPSAKPELVATAEAEFWLEPPTVTINEVKSGDPWSTITVNYTLGGTDAATDYKVAFDVTAGGVTKGVTNAAAKVENKGYSQEIDTAALFGAATPDTKAKVKVSLIALKPEAGVQLWEDGPYWAESNLGTSEVKFHPEYGALYNFADAAKKLGGDWRLPTKGELQKLASASYCRKEWDSVNMGYTFTGATVGYKDKSIFLPAAGYFDGFSRKYAGVQGHYWSSGKFGGNFVWYLVFSEGDAGVYHRDGDAGLSVRAVRDPSAKPEPVATAEAEFWLGPTVTINEVKSGEPWSKITVNYTLGGVDAATDYKVAFDVTAGGVTKGVTNDAAKVENKGYSQEIDTAALFGAATPDTKAKVKVSLIAVKPKPLPGVQLWEDGPYWAESNLGTSEVHDPAYTAEYGALYKFDDAAAVVTDVLGEGWRLPTTDEFMILDGTDDGDKVCSNVWTTCNGVAGRRFFGMTSGYEDKSIFLPAAGYDYGVGRVRAGGEGHYWSSVDRGDDNVRYLLFGEDYVDVYGEDRSHGLSVRAVRDPSAKPVPVAPAEAEFWLWPTEIKVSLTTGTGYGYAVSNLTLMAEIAPSSAGGTTYLLPIGAKVGIYCVAEADYDVVGTNPYVIEEVKFDTTIDAGELPTAEARPAGTEANPWMVGDGVTAYVKGATLIINGTGAVASTPWTDKADSVVELVKAKGVTGLEGIVATLPALTAVNGLTLAELNGLAAGAVKASGFNAIAIDPATQKATLTVVVKTAASVDAKEENWTEAATKDVEVEATSPTGFFIVAPPK